MVRRQPAPLPAPFRLTHWALFAMDGIPMGDRFNILLLMTDQHRGDALSCAGHPVLLTPNLDALAARGVRFTHFYSGCPSCIAARRSLLCGQEPASLGMVGYQDGVPWDHTPPTLPGVLHRHGYQTHLVGRRMHQHPPQRRFGYERMELNYHGWLARTAPAASGGWYGGGVLNNDWTARPWHLEEYLHFTNWTVTRAIEFLRGRDPRRPFFLTVSFLAPHPPLQPPAFYLERYLRTGVPEPVIGDWAIPPPHGFGEGGEDHVAPVRIHLKGEALRCARAAYYGLINHVDDQIRRLLHPKTGLDKETRRQTIIVFTSDHGEMLGDHYLWRKSHAYEASARVPFLIEAPEKCGLRRGSVVETPATLADIMPTLLNLVGIPVPDTVEGLSLWPLLRGERLPGREFVHIEHAPYHQGLTDGREKYIWSPRDGTEQLFDLRTDPDECRNLARRKSHATRLALWRQRLIEKLKNRPEGFTDGKSLIPGRPYRAVLTRKACRVPGEAGLWGGPNDG